MDTEFLNVVARPIGNFASVSEFHYQSLKVNVDFLQIIQLGLSFFDEHSNPPTITRTYQFNFNFNMTTDMYTSGSIDLLKAVGIDFKRHGVDCIDPIRFAELITTFGWVMMDSVVFLSFHSGYDFGYLMKLLTNAPLPTD
ncbi:hypothetical protein GJ496_001389 [Pomphorhynchus laevis]|nr:hypothetical protein GJ496_001389 [Pomphorhynchus laevis]